MAIEPDDIGIPLDDLLRGRGSRYESFTVEPTAINIYDKLIPKEAEKNVREAIKKFGGKDINIREKIMDFLEAHFRVQISELLVTGASVLAHARKPDFPLAPITGDKIESLSPESLDFLDEHLGPIVPLFGVDAEMLAIGVNAMLEQASVNFGEKLELLEDIKLKEIFAQEVAKLYQMLVHSQEVSKMPPEKAFEFVLNEVLKILDRRGSNWMKTNFPMLHNCFNLSMLPPEVLQKYKFKMVIATPEILRGIQKFLIERKIGHTPRVPTPHKGILIRHIAEFKYGDRLRMAEEETPKLLKALYDCLPETPKDLINELIDCAEAIVIEDDKGSSINAIMSAIFKRS
jgi:hypothetical protein